MRAPTLSAAGRKGRCLTAALTLLGLLLCGCGAKSIKEALPAETPFPAPEGLRIAVASDLHVNPDDTAKGPEATAVQYNLELLDALLWDARQQGAKFLLLTGDLVNGGKPHRHEALCQRLRQAEEAGLAIYVLPGNHDLAPVTQTDFASRYAAFGYDEACSRDPVSLSYCVIRDGLMLLMMDTGGYSTTAIDLTAPPQHEEAFLSEETLGWAERMLEKAREDGLCVLCAGHYNLLPALSRTPGSGYYVENGERFKQLLQENHVPLYLSGHMHIRAVDREAGLTELITEYPLSYPTSYSMLDVGAESIRYLPRRIDVDGWAAQAGSKDPILRDFARWQREGLRSYSRENVDYMSERNPLSRREKAQAADFFFETMSAFWDGSLCDRRAELEQMPGYGPFFRCAEGYAYGWWLKDLIETAVPELGGFMLARVPQAAG